VSDSVLRTVLTEVEAILHSKPLGFVSSDIADCDPVTPNTLLIGRPDPSLPQVVYPANELLGRRRWRHSQVIADQFWKNFVKFYLPSLQLRNKWHREGKALKVGDVVMIVDPQLIRSLWPVGRVIETILSPDMRVRTARIKVGQHVYTRPVARLVLLPELL
jgi:hypothetical protein